MLKTTAEIIEIPSDPDYEAHFYCPNCGKENSFDVFEGDKAHIEAYQCTHCHTEFQVKVPKL